MTSPRSVLSLCAFIMSVLLGFTPASATETTTYTYDALGRLTASAITGSVNNGVQTATALDPAGNRTSYATTGAASYDPDAAAYFAAMTVQPSAARKTLINTLIVGLKADGVWSKLSWLSLLAAHDAQAARLNAVTPTKSFTAAGSASFTVDRGYQGNGTGATYLDASEGFTTAGQFTQNSAFIATYVNLSSAGSGGVGQGFSAGAWAMMGIASDYSCSCFMNNLTQFAPTAPSWTGLFTLTRTASTTTTMYRGTTSFGASSDASTGVPTSGTVRSLRYGSERQAAAMWGSGLTAANVSNLNSRLVTYLTALGAN